MKTKIAKKAKIPAKKAKKVKAPVTPVKLTKIKAKTVQKKGKVPEQKKAGGPPSTAQEELKAKVNTDQKKIVADQIKSMKDVAPKLNECCKFKREDIKMLKMLLADKENITNPFQMQDVNQNHFSLNTVKGK
jgi:hypothetical protein